MKQVLIFFGLSYSISWIIWLPLYAPSLGINHLPVIPFHHAIGAWGPMIASLLTTYFFEGKGALKRLLKKCIQLRPLLYLLIALLSPFALAVIAASINTVANHVSFNLSGLFNAKEFSQFNIVTFFLYNLVFFGFGEEVGWRGFALSRFQNRFNALSSSVLLTVFWALWHLPLFLYRPGYTSMGFAGVAGWFFSLLTGSVLLTWLYNSSRASILVCAVFHSTIDIAFTADFTQKNIINYMGFLITIWGILTILIFKPQHLSRIKKISQKALLS